MTIVAGEGGRRRVVAKPKIKTKKPVQSYGARPVAQRQAQLRSKGVLAPTYGAAIKQEHARRIQQLKTSPGARKRLATRETQKSQQQLAQTIASSLGHGLAGAPRLKKIQPQHQGGLGVGTITGAASLGAKIGLHAAVPALGALDVVTHGRVAKDVVKAAKNVLPDTKELVTGVVPSTYHLATTAIHHPGQAAKMIAAPYIELAKHPEKFATEHPVSTFLMLSPSAKVPLRFAGRALRVTGKQSLKGEVAGLAGTALKEQRVLSKSATKNYRQVRKAEKAAAKRAPGEAAQITSKELNKRVDEFAGYQQRRIRQAQAHTLREHVQEQRQLHPTRKARRANRPAANEALKQKLEASRAQAKHETNVEFAREFGAVHHPSTHFEHKPGAQGTVGGPESVGKPGITTTKEQFPVGHPVRNETGYVAEHSAEVRDSRGHLIGHYTVPVDEFGRRGSGDLSVAPAHQRNGVATAMHDALTKSGVDFRTGKADLTPEGKAFHAAIENRHLISSKKAAKTLAQQVEDTHGTAMKVKRLTSPSGETSYGVVSRQAAERMYGTGNKAPLQNRLLKTEGHARVGVGGGAGVHLLRTTRSALSQAVLPLSPKWLSANAAESALRAAVSRSGVGSYRLAGRVLKAAEKQEPGSAARITARATPGGFIGETGRGLDRRTYEEQLQGTHLARMGRAMTSIGKKPGPKQVHAVWRKATDFSFDMLNGKIIEGVTQKAMLGRALKESPLMEKSLVHVSDKAVQEAAHGLRNTENQVIMGREVQKMFGKYSNFSPGMREAVLQWTPFMPWYANAARFIAHTLPKDHPLVTGLAASTNAMMDDWRASHHLSTRYGGKLPQGMEWLLGSVPTKGGGSIRLGSMTPFGAYSSDIGETAANLVMPQIMGTIKGLGGVDPYFKSLHATDRYTPITQHGSNFKPHEKAIYAGASLMESLVPGLGMIARATGVQKKYIEHKRNPGSIKDSALKEVNPLREIKPPARTAKRRVRAVSAGGWSSGTTSGSGGWSGTGASSGGGWR